jgi:hypothetical protein
MRHAKRVLLALLLLSATLPLAAWTRFGLRTGAGMGFGQNSWKYGNGQSGEGFASHPGDGLAWQFEGLLNVSPYVELGLGLFSPLGVDAKGSVSYTDVNSYYDINNPVISEEASVKFSSLPILLNVYYRAPLVKGLFAFGGLGAGYAMGGDSTSASSYSSTGGKYSYPNYSSISYYESSRSKSYQGTSSMNGAFAYRGSTGLEYMFNKTFSIFALVAYTSASFTPSKKVEKSTDTSDSVNSNSVSSGKSYSHNESTTESTTTYVASQPAYKSQTSIQTSTTTASGATTVVETGDDGVRTWQKTRTSSSVSSGGDYTYTTKEVIKEEIKLANPPTATISQVSALVGVAMRF